MWMIDSPSVEGEGSIYEMSYYKDLPPLANDAQSTITRTQTPDGKNQTIYATIYELSDLLETKIFACGGDVYPGYKDSALVVEDMHYSIHGPVEKKLWNYPCYPLNC